jgi:hypothetical protein
VKNGEEAGDRSRVSRGGDVGGKVVVGDDASGVDVVSGDIDGEESDRGVVDGGAFVHGFFSGTGNSGCCCAAEDNGEPRDCLGVP